MANAGVTCSRVFRVLLAEDNPVNQEVAVALLEQAGCEVSVVENGDEAVAAFKLEVFDLILMDVQMPGMDGLQATRCIREWEAEKQTSTPIVALTAHAMEQDRQRLLAGGMDDYLSKPYSSDQLLDKLRRYLPGPISLHRQSAPASKNVLAGGEDGGGALLDERVLDRIRALQSPARPSILKRLLELFLDDAPKQLVNIKQAYRTGDAESLRRLAHRMKSAAANLGATRLSVVCRDIEQSVAKVGEQEMQVFFLAYDEALAASQALLEEQPGAPNTRQASDKVSVAPSSERLKISDK
jgi:CheY-like chemotaxis protein/HPt (histidine-containing phosphotransfer) domain-containing protein